MVLNLKGKEIVIKKFAENEADIVMDFQDDVISRIPDKTTFVKETRDECMIGLQKGLILGAYLKDELVGLWSLIPFGELEENYGYDLDFTKEQLLKTINFENAIVKENARGIGLDKTVVNYAVEQMNKENDYFACTIALTNLPSIKAMVKNKFFIRRCKLKYGGYERYILLRDETEKNAFDLNSKVMINHDDKENIKKHLADGYCVCEVTSDNKFVFYKKIK